MFILPQFWMSVQVLTLPTNNPPAPIFPMISFDCPICGHRCLSCSGLSHHKNYVHSTNLHIYHQYLDGKLDHYKLLEIYLTPIWISLTVQGGWNIPGGSSSSSTSQTCGWPIMKFLGPFWRLSGIWLGILPLCMHSVIKIGYSGRSQPVACSHCQTQLWASDHRWSTMVQCRWPLCHNQFNSVWQHTMEELQVLLCRTKTT